MLRAGRHETVFGRELTRGGEECARKKTPHGRLEELAVQKDGTSRFTKNLGLVAKALLVAVRAHTLLPLVLVNLCFPAFF